MVQSVQVNTTTNTFPWIRQGEPYTFDAAVLLQDAGRTTELVSGTVLARNPTTRKYVPLTDVTPTPTKAKLVCGALGTGLAGFQAVTDGEFALTIDGVAMNITALDFTGLLTPGSTPAKLVGGAFGTNLAGFQAVTDGTFNVTVNGIVIGITGLNWSAINTLNEIAEIINEQAAGRFYCESPEGNVLTISSNIAGTDSTITFLSAQGTGTDVSGAGFLNAGTGVGTPTAGTGGTITADNITDIINAKAAGRFMTVFDGTTVTFLSPQIGTDSTITVLSAVSGGSGTDISGAGFLNGLTGTGTATQGTSHDGTELPNAILMESITAAALVAGDVTGKLVAIGGQGLLLDRSQLTLEGSLSFTDVITSVNQTIEDYMRMLDMYLQSTRALQGLQT